MALQKSKTLGNGSSGNYWRLTNATFDREGLKVTCHIALYTSQSIANSANKHLGLVKYFEFSVVGMDLSGDIRALVYGKIKTLAATIVSTDAFGNAVTPHAYDTDLDGATDV